MGDFLRWQREKFAARRELALQTNPPAPSRPADLELLRSTRASLTWVGHATFVLRLGGKVVVIDPVWSDRIGGFVRRLVPPGLPLDALPSPDLVLVTHNHWDHLDLPTLRKLGPRPTYVVPLGNGRLLRKLGARVIELDWWQSHAEGDLQVTLVPARHWSTVDAVGPQLDALGRLCRHRGTEGAAYHSGDTGCFDGFTEIGRRAGPLRLGPPAHRGLRPALVHGAPAHEPLGRRKGIREPPGRSASSPCTGARSS